VEGPVVPDAGAMDPALDGGKVMVVGPEDNSSEVGEGGITSVPSVDGTALWSSEVVGAFDSPAGRLLVSTDGTTLGCNLLVVGAFIPKLVGLDVGSLPSVIGGTAEVGSDGKSSP
jgi:hypothetical protein